ncbi:NAD-dependent epimerase/dehydratase family protein [Uliginosibacterium gangwonense]|uniref:NAD-dependent epimerase/dehydratase family protein n=1 Tax=Uliginosibacterium gangwonense TaxID=392736 RepID=UPI00047782BD|nr:NAD(P)-dependent oxidoreductase [Uliginosibacterium gangwonense]
MAEKFRTCVIFGGTGFIGSHLALFLTTHHLAERVVLADIAPMRHDFEFDLRLVEYVELDVRSSIDRWILPESTDLIANFAAIHREPGHALHEYYETNLPGADNVCAWADRVGCNKLIFTSSIAPYGPTEEPKTEESIPTPVSGYGGSKLAAEKIHIAWQRSKQERCLVIVRPGVVFGPGERGNVTRLIQATLKRYFFFLGNRHTRKAGGYVKELVNSMLWALDRLPESGGAFLFNFCLPQTPTVQDYVVTTCNVAGVTRFVPSVPYTFLLAASYLIEGLSRVFGVEQPVSPIRIRKLVRSNNIEPAVLKREGYVYMYSLEAAMSDWKADRPDEWC